MKNYPGGKELNTIISDIFHTNQHKMAIKITKASSEANGILISTRNSPFSRINKGAYVVQWINHLPYKQERVDLISNCCSL